MTTTEYLNHVANRLARIASEVDALRHEIDDAGKPKLFAEQARTVADTIHDMRTTWALEAYKAWKAKQPQEAF